MVEDIYLAILRMFSQTWDMKFGNSVEKNIKIGVIYHLLNHLRKKNKNLGTTLENDDIK